MMKERTLRVLEFTKILDMLASFAVTDMGREACEKLTPLSDLAQVNEALEETEEAQVILTYLGDSPLIGFPDVRPYLTLAAKGAALNPKALLSVAECLRASRAARSALVTDRDNTPRMTGLACRSAPSLRPRHTRRAQEPRPCQAGMPALTGRTWWRISATCRSVLPMRAKIRCITSTST